MELSLECIEVQQVLPEDSDASLTDGGRYNIDLAVIFMNVGSLLPGAGVTNTLLRRTGCSGAVFSHTAAQRND